MSTSIQHEILPKRAADDWQPRPALREAMQMIATIAVDDDTALHVMLRRQRLDCAISLLVQGASANIVGSGGNNALHLAIEVSARLSALRWCINWLVSPMSPCSFNIQYGLLDTLYIHIQCPYCNVIDFDRQRITSLCKPSLYSVRT